jgi:hypothetical protein
LSGVDVTDQEGEGIAGGEEGGEGERATDGYRNNDRSVSYVPRNVDQDAIK